MAHWREIHLIRIYEEPWYSFDLGDQHLLQSVTRLRPALICQFHLMMSGPSFRDKSVAGVLPSLVSTLSHSVDPISTVLRVVGIAVITIIEGYL